MNRRFVRKNSKNRRGFTLTEIMLVLVIISILAGLVVVSTSGMLGSAKKKAAATEVQKLSQFVNQYMLVVGSLPTKLSDLHEKPSNLANANNWDQVSEKPIGPDPWGQEYVFTPSGETFEIRSNGPDGQPNTPDDISSKPSQS
jgi:general secretion pathway protein G